MGQHSPTVPVQWRLIGDTIPLLWVTIPMPRWRGTIFGSLIWTPWVSSSTTSSSLDYEAWGRLVRGKRYSVGRHWFCRFGRIFTGFSAKHNIPVFYTRWSVSQHQRTLGNHLWLAGGADTVSVKMIKCLDLVTKSHWKSLQCWWNFTTRIIMIENHWIIVKQQNACKGRVTDPTAFSKCIQQRRFSYVYT